MKPEPAPPKYKSFMTCPNSSSHPQVFLDACFVKTQIKHDEGCGGCTDWMEKADPDAFKMCPHCSEPLLILRITRCPVCKGRFIV